MTYEHDMQHDTRISRPVLVAFIIAIITPLLLVGSMTASTVAAAGEGRGADASAHR